MIEYLLTWSYFLSDGEWSIWNIEMRMMNCYFFAQKGSLIYKWFHIKSVSMTAFCRTQGSLCNFIQLDNVIQLVLYPYSECGRGKYGANCRETCDQCSEQACDRFNGHCNISCAEGWKNFPSCDRGKNLVYFYLNKRLQRLHIFHQ